MSTYTFELNDYHAVKKACITIDGLTVLSGINGSGKSTVARWLHNIVKILNEYDSMVEQEAIEELQMFMSGMRRVVNNLGSPEDNREMFFISNELSERAPSSIVETSDIFSRVLEIVRRVMTDYADSGKNLSEFSRYENFLLTKIDNSNNIYDYITEVVSNLNNYFKTLLDSTFSKKTDRNIRNFAEKVATICNRDIDNSDINIGFSEDGTELITDTEFKQPLNLSRVIYINTQTLGNALSPFSDTDLSKMLHTGRGTTTAEASAISRLIRNVIGGDVKVEKSTKSIARSRKTYTFVDIGGESFDLRAAATGIISFSYILQLLSNGWIDGETLLIIDEPESHLHPQWIVDYARVLVLLCKVLGTKVLISSHNPDMVSAIETIASREEIIDKTNFYLAEKDSDGSPRYTFQDLGNNIERIFDSFNIAIDRIALFGQS
ncbi:MAG: ATP-binding protein [Muribaculaceae bacterium]|nr:ATP-binding protein [Muribaculaceae bacterium]